jgi:hypothetical protein
MGCIMRDLVAVQQAGSRRNPAPGTKLRDKWLWETPYAEPVGEAATENPGFPLSFGTRGRLASTGLVKEWQRAQVQVPGKTVWNDSTANNELALAA